MFVFSCDIKINALLRVPTSSSDGVVRKVELLQATGRFGGMIEKTNLNSLSKEKTTAAYDGMCIRTVHMGDRAVRNIYVILSLDTI
jgi:hypothetical protein